MMVQSCVKGKPFIGDAHSVVIVVACIEFPDAWTTSH
jgi:hypothetical protein